MGKIGKKILAVLLFACLLSAYCTMTAFADDTTTEIGGVRKLAVQQAAALGRIPTVHLL